MTVREVKQRFFSLRNGLLADMLRKQCATPNKLIFGLNLPQLKEIAAEAGVDPELAHELWADVECRESRLLAPMVSEPAAEALRMISEVRTPEESDVVCHSLLRRCPGAREAALEALNAPTPIERYCALRLLLNLMPEASDAALKAVATVEFHPLTDGLVRQLRQAVEESAPNPDNKN